MNKLFTYIVAVAALLAIASNAKQAQAFPAGNDNLEFNATFQDSTGLGIGGKLGVSENISIRPKVVFGIDKSTNIGIDLNLPGTEYGVAATYDIPLSSSGRKGPTAFLGPEISFWNGNRTVSGQEVTANSTIVSAIAGVNYPVTDSLDFTGRLTVPVSSTGSTSVLGVSNSADFKKTVGVSIGAAYRF
jgi:Outer membrane protein beta-barrel domain